MKTNSPVLSPVIINSINSASSFKLKAQIRERQSAMREVKGQSSPDRTNTQGLKITEENVLTLQLYLQMVKRSNFLGKGI